MSAAGLSRKRRKVYAREGASMESLLKELRRRGWMVAVHNDYMQNGVLHTFWLFTKGGRCVKGEGLQCIAPASCICICPGCRP